MLDRNLFNFQNFGSFWNEENMMKMKKIGAVGWKVCALVVICFSFVIYINWEIVPKQIIRVNFTAIKMDGNIQIVPKVIHLNNSTEEMTITKAYNTQHVQYDLRIIAIVYNRAHSLLRLLDSLNEAEYASDSVKLEVWIDRSEDDKIDSLTVQTAQKFEFKHGQYSVMPHPHHVGIYGQWLTTWKPKMNSSEIAVILEDDLTVSRYFYRYLKLVHQQYDRNPEINGYALQGTTIKHHVRDQSTLKGPKDSLVFLYPVLGTWGFSPSRDNWMKFLDWFSKAHSDKKFQPYVPENIITDWYKIFQKQGRAQGMWSIWHIYHAWMSKEYTLYTNFQGHMGLSVNWMEAGLHYSARESKASNKMLTEWKPEFENLPEIPSHLNIAGNVISL